MKVATGLINANLTYAIYYSLISEYHFVLFGSTFQTETSETYQYFKF